jgi:ubiquinone/menaquinone biosynthesis C-methylase UbiE
MSRYYRGKHTLHYNQRWHSYLERTLAETLSMLDLAALQTCLERTGHRPRVLDVACGTGLLLKRLIELIQHLEAYGVDASADMLMQARITLKEYPAVHLTQACWSGGETAGLPYAPETFDVITCMNTLHYIQDPVAALSGLKHLLIPEGSLILEDYARRSPPFPWPLIEWLLHKAEGTYQHAYTLSEAQSLSVQAGYEVMASKAFVIDWFWHGWVLRLR